MNAEMHRLVDCAKVRGTVGAGMFFDAEVTGVGGAQDFLPWIAVCCDVV